MRIYWYGDGRVVRVPLSSGGLAKMGTAVDLSHALATRLGFPTLLDWTNRLEVGDEVVIFGPQKPGSALAVPGREDLEAESLVVWMRGGAAAGLFFAQTIADLVTILSTIALYEKALCEITEYRERFMEIRARHAQDTEYGRNGSEGT